MTGWLEGLVASSMERATKTWDLRSRISRGAIQAEDTG